MLEKVIEAYLGRCAKEVGGMSLKWTGVPGVPDRIVLLPGGRLALVEVKTLGGKVSPLQRLIHGRIRALGIPVFVVWTKTEVDALMAHLMSQQPRGWGRLGPTLEPENEIQGMQVVRGTQSVGGRAVSPDHGEDQSQDSGW